MEISGPTRIALALTIVGSAIIWHQMNPEQARFSHSFGQSDCEARTLNTVVGRLGCNSPGVSDHFIRPGG